MYVRFFVPIYNETLSIDLGQQVQLISTVEL